MPESRIHKQLSRRLVRTSLPPPTIAWCYRAISQGPRAVGPRAKIKGGRGERCNSRCSVRRAFSRSSTVSKRGRRSSLLSSLFTRHAHPIVSVPYISLLVPRTRHTTPASGNVAETRGLESTVRADCTHTRTRTRTRDTHTVLEPTPLNRA